MTLVVGVAFRDGVVVASDRAFTLRDGETLYGHGKLFMAGGRLFSLSGRREALDRVTGEKIGSVPEAVIRAAPARLEETDIPRLADAVAEAFLEQQRAAPGVRGQLDGTRLVFWWPDRAVAVYVPPDGSRIQPPRVDCYQTEAGWRHIKHGIVAYVDEHVGRARRLTPGSYELLNRRSCAQTTREEATAFVIDMIETTERTLKIVSPVPWGTIGGGIDLAVVTSEGVTIDNAESIAPSAGSEPRFVLGANGAVRVARQHFTCSRCGAETASPLADRWKIGPPDVCAGCLQ